MNKYKSHKIIEAGVLLGVTLNPPTLHLVGGESINVDSAYMANHTPAPNGYYAKEEDGHEFWLPAKDFELLYTLVEEGAPKGQVDPSKIYFFGCGGGQKGHFLYSPGMRVSYVDNETLPFSRNILDGGLLPRHPETQGELHLAAINGWTMLSMWDRTGDSRSASNAVFLAKGTHSLDDMKAIAIKHFPDLWKRIQGE